MSPSADRPRALAPTARAVALAGVSAIVLGALSRVPMLVADPRVVGLLLPLLALVLELGLAMTWLSRRRDLFSPLGLVSAFYAATFIGGSLYFWLAKDDPLSPRFDSQLLPAVEWMATVAYGAFALAYVTDPLRFLRRLRRPVTPRPQRFERNGAAVVGGLLVLGWLARAVLVSRGSYFHIVDQAQQATASSALTVVVGRLPLLAVTYLFCWAYSVDDEPRRRLLRFAWVLVPIEFAWALPSGSRANVLTIGAMVIVVRYYALGRLPRARVMVALGLAGVLFVFPVLLTYRDVDRTSSSPSAAFVQTVDQTVSEGPGAAIDSGFTATFSRFAATTSVAAALGGGRDGTGVPAGATYTWLASQLLPRAVWPDKPDPGRFGVTFALRYGINNYSDDITSVAITQFLEAWFAAGYLGVVLISLALGALYRVAGELTRGRAAPGVVLAVYAWIAWPVINSQETIVANGTMLTLKSVLVASTLIWVLGRVPQLRRAGAAPARTPLREALA